MGEGINGFPSPGQYLKRLYSLVVDVCIVIVLHVHHVFVHYLLAGQTIPRHLL